MPDELTCSPGGALRLTGSQWIGSSELTRVVSSVSTRVGLPAQDRNDLLQEVSLLLLRAPPGSLLNRSYVFKLAHHRAIDIFFRRSRPAPPTPAHPSSNELLLLLRAGVSALPERLRTVCRLLFLEGLSEREAATKLHVSRAVIRRLEARTLRLLGRTVQAGSGQRAAGSGQRAAGSGQRAAGSEKATIPDR